MSLIKCRECGTEISDKASACPKCGAKLGRKVSWVGIALVVFIGVFAYRCSSLQVARNRVAVPDKPTVAAVPGGGVAIGMTAAQVLASTWGKPKDINRTTRASGVHEQWVYGNGNYLYFENGVVTSIQN